MRQLSTILLLTLLIASCNTDKDKFIIQTEDQYDTIDGKKLIVLQTIKTLRNSDSLPITTLIKVSNYSNDARMKYLTGLTKEDGLQDYLLDSIFYDEIGNDTLKKAFVHLDNNWQPTQTFYKKFTNRQVSYFMTERPFKKDHYFKKEVFYAYNNTGKILTETEVECRLKNDCDSIFKTKYIYNSTGKLDSTILYTWKENEWTEYKRKNGR